ncbi:MAG: alpha-ketoacid dehydrogenase subunit beta [bacterium]
MSIKTMRDALNEALREEMRRDESVFLIGEDIGVYGGAYSVTKGLYEEFGPERVRDTAVSEQLIVGAAVGAAMTGMRPVAEIMYVDFLTLAADQLFNQAAKIRYMFGGKAKVPMVLRTQGGSGRCIAAHHSQSLEALVMHFPGILLVMPSTPYDAKGLLKSAIRDDNPIVFIEHKSTYGNKGEVPDEEYLIPLGVGDIKRPGKDATIVAYSRMVDFSLEAAEELAKEGIEVEIVDPRTLKPLDMNLIVESVKKTHRAVVVHEAYRTNGVGAEIAARIMEEAFDYLDAPVERVCGVDVVIPMSEPLERAAIPSPEKIVASVKKVLYA